MAKKKEEMKKTELETGDVLDVIEQLGELIPEEEIDVDEEAGEAFYRLIEEYEESARGAAAWEKRKKIIGPILEAANLLADRKHMLTPEFRITRIESKAADRISAEKLIDQGVEWEIVANATIPGTEYSYVTVTKIEEG